MDSEPTQYGAHAGTSPSDLPNPSAMVSLFQSNLIGLTIGRTLGWSALTSGVSAVMTVSY
jgi:hypothetical protein